MKYFLFLLLCSVSYCGTATVNLELKPGISLEMEATDAIIRSIKYLEPKLGKDDFLLVLCQAKPFLDTELREYGNNLAIQLREESFTATSLLALAGWGVKADSKIISAIENLKQQSLSNQDKEKLELAIAVFNIKNSDYKQLKNSKTAPCKDLLKNLTRHLSSQNSDGSWGKDKESTLKVLKELLIVLNGKTVKTLSTPAN